jgi:hypothetical protein
MRIRWGLVWSYGSGGNFVRTHRQLTVYGSIFQALNKPGCPFCCFLKEFQAARLQNAPDVEIRNLCNFHMWGLAAVQNAPVAADVFLKLVDEPLQAIQGDARCDICKEVSDEEDLRIREFVSCIDRDDIVRWLKGDAVLCISHGMRLRRQVPFVLTAHIDAILENCRQQLTYELQQLRNELEPHRLGWGALGRAAEFLVSQRGLRA